MEEKNVKKITKRQARKPRSQRLSSEEDEIHYHYHMDEGESKRPRRDYGAEASSAGPGVHYHYYYEPPKQIKKKSSKPTVAAVLLIVTTILGLIAGIGLIGLGSFIGEMGEGFEFFGEDTKADITGTVTYEDGTGAENVTISIVDEPLTTQTDSDGNYILQNVPTGNQKLKVEKEGYDTIIYKAYIGPNGMSDNHDNDDDFENEFDFTLTEGDETVERGSYPPWALIRTFMVICAVLIIIFSIFAAIGAIYAYHRRSFGVAMIGAILGLFTILGSLFALIAIFILALSRDEFKKRTYEEPIR